MVILRWYLYKLFEFTFLVFWTGIEWFSLDSRGHNSVTKQYSVDQKDIIITYVMMNNNISLQTDFYMLIVSNKNKLIV